ncbi:hypothetical protein VBD025_13700 [Virgibacillus flavescens]|uniref:hypothetical protein n=1 Tax=Virgibacillus flavescens TaxID=1611422 RepID=UPI003D325B98
MERTIVKIGGHIAELLCLSGKASKFVEDNYQEYIDTTGAGTDITIKLTSEYGMPFVDYLVEIEEKPDKILFRRADYLIEVNAAFSQAKIMFYDGLALKHALMNLYSSFIIHHNWGLLVHSSCVVENGNAHIFCGISGAGKSTVAELSMPRQILSDEATILKITDQEITVFNSPFRSEIKALGQQQTAPIQSIELLYQSLRNKQLRLKKTEALLELIDKVFYWSYKEEDTIKVFRLLMQLVNNVSVNRLHFRKDDTFWELITDEVYS